MGRNKYKNRNSKNGFYVKKDIVTPKGEIIRKGSKVTGVVVIAGGQRRRKIDEIDGLVAKYGGNAKDWTKRRGTAIIDGKQRQVHYYQNDKIGKVKFKTIDKKVIK